MRMKHKRPIKYLALVLAPAILIALMVFVPALGINTVQPPYDTCTQCHNDTTLITGKKTEWKVSGHGTGEAYVRGTSASCAGCHSGAGFSARIAAGLQPNQVTVGDPNPTRQDCRTCHQIHETFNGADWALETTAPVNLYIYTGVTFDGGEGNLCASCHQPRTKAPSVPAGGTVTGISTHWGPHHGPQSSMMLGIGGAGAAAGGSPAAHYSAVADTCVTCHMSDTRNHTYEPKVATCQACHTGATNFDINGVQTQVQGKLDNLKTLLVNASLLSCSVDAEGVEECHPAVTSAPDNQAYALWNWIYVNNEDSSKGVHNADYTNALLDQSIAAMSPSCDGAPALALGQPNPFWASYADYQARLLSVTYPVNNTGGTNAINVMLTYSNSTSGVTLASSMPATAGNIAAGASAPVTLQYTVPEGVTSFRTTNGATAEDNCGTTYTYGTQPPSP